MIIRKLTIISCIGVLLFVTLGHTEASSTSYSKESIIKQIRTHQKKIALTFDDGPDPRYTPAILKILQEHGAKGTFFVIGQKAKAKPEILKTMVKNQDEIGNHTFFHHLSRNIDISDIEQCEDIIFSITQQHTHLFRPPGGYLSENIVKNAMAAHYKIVMWSWDEDTRDWSRPGVKKIIDRVLNHISPGDIVLFHDGGGNRRQTVQALPLILDGLKEKGYQCVTVSELIHAEEPLKGHKLK